MSIINQALQKAQREQLVHSRQEAPYLVPVRLTRSLAPALVVVTSGARSRCERVGDPPRVADGSGAIPAGGDRSARTTSTCTLTLFCPRGPCSSLSRRRGQGERASGIAHNPLTLSPRQRGKKVHQHLAPQPPRQSWRWCPCLGSRLLRHQGWPRLRPHHPRRPRQCGACESQRQRRSRRPERKRSCSVRSQPRRRES